jgi:hypothetical protein
MWRVIMLDKLKKVVMKGILADQSGLDTLEYVAIAGTVILVLLAIFAIIRSIAIRGW